MFERKIAIIGCGAIGSILAKSIDEGNAGNTELRVLFDLQRKRAEELAGEISTSSRVADEIEDVLDDDEVDLVVEAASQEAVSEYSVDVLRSGKDLIILSIGAFSDQKLLSEVREAAEDSGQFVYLPSGAILGVDGIQAAEIAGFEEAVLTTRKSPETLSKTKFVRENDIDLSGLTEPRVVFEGPASEAVEAFPESVNVAATLSLAGSGFQDTRVKIVADPSLDQNVHEIKVRGEAGEFTTKAMNFPSPENPKTSYIAALSAIRTLRNLTGPIWIGA
ncbi:hypothetical protein AKJ65_01620 [candidate division MSBL1 archaeon SCGC-AAA259E19]|uniref:L-aspartate dehydrogenase n=1 Tax=candidate division MSBL1 archaeon SCGC-AAA259E19 TaxID=1698264 RepID=A0A133UMP1_9EURY|nr:hypothetical protein AKJ65_01620 [candidate division MSBL1 archaeon SCGC-AAA259E19]